MAIQTRITQRFDVLSNWIQNDIVLLQGELAVVDCGSQTRFKVGDGTKRFIQLPFVDQNQLCTRWVAADAVSQGLHAPAVPYGFAAGAYLCANASFSQALGFDAKTISSDTYSFVWNGDDTRAIEDYYTSHGKGTFSVNPLSGLSGVFIGEQNLAEVLDENSGNTITIDDRISGICKETDLSIVRLSANDYADLVASDALLSDVLYVVEGSYEDVYGQQIKNMAPGTDLSDAVNLEQLAEVSSRAYDTYTKTETDQKIANAQYFKKYVVQTLPPIVDADERGIYLVPSTDQQLSNTYDEYVVVVGEDTSKAWEKIGAKNIDLSGYKTKQDELSSPTASGSATAFIDTISQDENGVITATKKNVQAASTTQAGIVQLNNTLTSTSTIQAATANAVKLLNDTKVATSVKVAGQALTSDVTAATISSAIGLDNYLTEVPSDYKTYAQTKLSLSGDGYATQDQLNEKSAVSVDNVKADVNMVHISLDDYSEKLVGGEILSNELYVISADYVETYGQQIKNVAEPTDLSDAATKGYVDNAVQGVQIPTDLSAFTNSPGYLVSNDISGYYKKSETSSAVEILNALSVKAEISSLTQYLALSGGTLSSGAVIHFGDDWLLSTGINPIWTNYKELKISASNGQTWTFDDSGDPDAYGDGNFVIRDRDLYSINDKLVYKADILPFAQTFEDSDEPARHIWNSETSYSASSHDCVAYEGRFYSCVQDADGSHPPTDTAYWSEIPYSLYAQYNGFSMMTITWAGLIGMRDAGLLFPGVKYRITDYVTAVDQEDCRSAGHPFDLIVTAVDHHTLDENARATIHEGDDYFAARPFHVPDYQQYLEYARVPLESWEIKYCLDNDKTRFKFADTENGKGVIYYMKDEFGNEAPYDFKNVQFKRYKITSSPGASDLDGMYGLAVGGIEVDTSDEMWCYTFNGADYADFGFSEPYDFSGWHVRPTQAVLQQFGGPSVERLQECTGNAIQARQEDGDDYSLMSFKLPNNVFHCVLDQTPVSELPFLKIGYCFGNKLNSTCSSNTFGNDCSGNTFGNYCSSNTFGNYCNGNTFGSDCDSNTFGNSCSSNTFGSDCDSNTFGNSCSSNTFGSDCDSNTFGNSCGSNTFGSDCDSNTFGNSCSRNTFGNSCDSNTFGNSCGNNTFGSDCDSNTFGNSCGNNTFGSDCDSNTFGSDCGSNTFGNSCYSIKFASTTTSDSSQAKSYYKYINIDSGNWYIILNCTQSTYAGNEYKNVRILPGVNNTTSYKMITDSNVNQSFCTTYQPANSQVIAV